MPATIDDEAALMLDPLGVALHATDWAQIRIGGSVQGWRGASSGGEPVTGTAQRQQAGALRNLECADLSALCRASGG